MNIWELCTCTEGQICSFCKTLVVLGIVILSGLAGYIIGRKKK